MSLQDNTQEGMAVRNRGQQASLLQVDQRRTGRAKAYSHNCQFRSKRQAQSQTLYLPHKVFSHLEEASDKVPVTVTSESH